MICPVCKTQKFNKWGKVGLYDILQCHSCGLGITSPFPSEEVLILANEEIYQVDKRIHAYLSRQKYFEDIYKQHLKRIKNYKISGKLLDVGCNIGLFLKVARDEGYDVKGVELNKTCAAFGAKHFNLDIRSELLQAIAFPEKSFDVITLFDVLEHVADLHSFISELGRVLKDDGLLVLQSPNFDSLMANVTKSKWNWLTPPDHLYHFSPRALGQLLEESGFRVKIVDTWEPADEFATNVLSWYKSKNMFGKILWKINQITKIASFAVSSVQRIWWRKERGGLLRICAVKNLERH